MVKITGRLLTGVNPLSTALIVVVLFVKIDDAVVEIVMVGISATALIVILA